MDAGCCCFPRVLSQASILNSSFTSLNHASVFTIPFSKSLQANCTHISSEELAVDTLRSSVDTLEVTSLLQQGSSQARNYAEGKETQNRPDGSTTVSATLSTSSDVDSQNRLSIGSCEMNMGADCDESTSKDNGAECKSALEVPIISQQEGMQADEVSSRTSLLEEKAVDSTNYTSILPQGTLSSYTSQAEEEAQYAADKQECDSIDIKRTIEADDSMNSFQQEGLDKNLSSLHNLSVKQFTRELNFILQQEDVSPQRIFLLQAIVIKSGFEQNSLISNILMSMYRRVGSVKEAAFIFTKMHSPSVVSWNSMMSLLSEQKLPGQAFQLYLEMRKQDVEPSQITLITALSICTDLANGKAIHAYILDHVAEPCVKLLNALINMYGKCGDVEAARAVFDNMHMRDVVSWNSILAVYSENMDWKWSKGKECMHLFRQMQQQGFQPDAITLITVVGLCANAGLLQDGICIHQYIVCNGFESNVVVCNALINMYGKCKSLDRSFMVFASLCNKTVVSWNALITACAARGQANKAFQVFEDMLNQGVIPNDITFLGMLNACTHPEALTVGKAIHKEISLTKLKSLCYINNALISMYGKCGALEDARSVFDNMSNQNVITWSTLIAAYSENGKGQEALELFRKMQHANIQPNGIMFLDILTTCCHAELLKEGTFFFDTMVNEYHITPNLKHYSCMVDLLGRVGQLQKAENMIIEMPHPPDRYIWSMLLAACRRHHDAEREKRIAKHVRRLDPQNEFRDTQLTNAHGAAFAMT